MTKQELTDAFVQKNTGEKKINKLIQEELKAMCIKHNWQHAAIRR